MGEPYAVWGHVPVYLRELDKSEFARDFVIPNPDPPQMLQQYDANGVSLFSSIKVNVDPKYHEVMAWHERQMREGVDLAVKVSPNGMNIIPAEGFYIVVTRYRTFHEQKGGFGSKVEIREDVSGLSFGQAKHDPYIWPVVDISDYRKLDEVGMDFNPYPDLFVRLALVLPKTWERWLRERRLKRWKPVPEWLVQIRTSRGRRRPPAAPAAPASTG